MPSSATITAPTGPGFSVDNLLLDNIRSFTVDCISKSLSVVMPDDTVRTFDLSATTTTSLTVNSGVFTLSVSQ